MKTQIRPSRASTTIPNPRPADAPVQARRRGRTVAATAAALAAGAGLTALVVGVTGGAEAEAPPVPGVLPAVEAPAQSGSDQRLLNEAAERWRREQLESAYGSDRRLYHLAESTR